MKKYLILSYALGTLFFACSNEEMFENQSKPEQAGLSDNLKANTLNRLVEKYGDAIESIEKDMVYFDSNTLRSMETNNDAPVEIAFPDKKRDLVRFKTGITIEACDSFYVYQGDILLSEEQIDLLLSQEDGTDTYTDDQAVKTRGTVLNHITYRWPYCIIKYGFKNDFTSRHRTYVREAIAEWTRACPFLQFIEVDNLQREIENNVYMYDCIFFMHGNGSYSSLGRQGGVQAISIDQNEGDKGTVMHELGHALGMIHEHNRRDRDNDIIVYMDNIIKKYRHNYETTPKSYNLLMTRGTSNNYSLNPDFSTTIDFNSIMLYPSAGHGFAINQNKPVMTKKDGKTGFNAQRNYIAKGDRSIIYSFYGLTPPLN